MTLLNPGFLSALALVSIPLLIHLIRRRKLKVIPWAAMDFLLQSQRRQRRRLRIEELILLALRMLIVAVAVMAFVRPVLKALGVGLLTPGTRIYAIIALDNSYSMQFRSPSDGRTSFERARQAAEEILTKVLRQGDSASVVLLSDRPEELVGAPSYDLKGVLQRVRNARPGDRGTDYLAAAQTINRLLKTSRAPVKEVYWISDDQAAGWKSSAKEATRPVWEEHSRQARITWVSVGPPAEGRDNLAVESPVVGRELVTPHLPVRIEARIHNYGRRPRNDVLINLTVDGRLAGTRRISLPPGGSAVAQFVYLFGKPGVHIGRIALADARNADGLATDNAASFVVRARSQIKALIQDTHPAADPARSESFYLMTAMAPGGAAESIDPRLREGDNLSGQNLRGFDVIVITNVRGLSGADRRALGEYTRAGGGLLLFPGPETDPTRVNADYSAGNLLPAKLLPRKTLSVNDALSLNPATMTGDALSLFKETTTMNLGTAHFTTYYPLQPLWNARDPNAVQVLARFSNGDPAFVERREGFGRVILAASSSGTSWNELPLKPAFVPLAYQLVSYLSQGPTARHNLRLDEPFFRTLPLTDANKPMRVTGPDGRIDSLSSVLEARGVTASYLATVRAGIYRLEVVGGKTKDAFAVGLPGEESDLTYAEPRAAGMQAGLNAGRLTIARDPSRLPAAVRQSRYGTEIWRALIWTLVPLLLLESLLAQHFGRRG